ncbi:MAG: hypothetical protein JWM93_2491 [Frankiales bacterium]|nr:hypothetical protein [Frankiales bacterium]MCW3015879.1 hypothetical protein [Solirubrobacterales bacterium]
MARIAVVIPDLLLGSNTQGALRAAGHDAAMVAADAPLADYDLVVVDLMADGVDPAAFTGLQRPTLGVFAHTQPDIRQRALDAGFDLVVPRSRMAREGAALVAGLLER